MRRPKQFFLKLFLAPILLLVFAFVVQAGGTDGLEEDIQKLKTEWADLDPDSPAAIDVLNEIAYIYRRIDIRQLQQYGKMALQKSQKTGYLQGQVVAKKNLAIALQRMGASVDSIITAYDEVYELAVKSGDFYTQAASKNNVSFVYRNEERPSEGLVKLEEAHFIYKQHLEKSNRLNPIILGNMGESYQQLGNHKIAADYFLNAAQVSKKYNYPELEYSHLSDYGEALYQLGSYQKAEDLINEVIPKLAKLGDKVSVMQAYHNLAKIGIEKQDYEIALHHAQKAIELSREVNYSELECVYLQQQAHIFFQQKKFAEAEAAALQTLTCSEGKTRLSPKLESNEILIKIYEQNGRTEELVKRYRDYVQLQKLHNEKNTKNTSKELAFQYEHKNEKMELAFLNEQDRTQKKIIFFLTVGFILVFAVMIFVWKMNRYLKKAKTLLQQKNKKLKSNEIAIAAQNKKLSDYIASNGRLEQFAHVASHDIKAPLRNIINFAQLIKKDARQTLSTSQKQFLNYILQSAGRLDELVHDLLSYAKVNAEKIEVSQFNFKQTVEEVLQNINYEIINYGVEVRLENCDQEVHADLIKVRQVLQNLISNAIKFRNPEGTPKLKIGLEDTGEHFQISVSDNGRGIEEKYQHTIFESFKRLVTASEVEGTGLGLSICKSVVEKHGGNIWMQSEVGKGTTFFFTICKSLGEKKEGNKILEEEVLSS